MGQLAFEFGRSKPHIFYLLTGERTQSPIKAAVIKRQRELIAAAQDEAMVALLRRRPRKKARAA